MFKTCFKNFKIHRLLTLIALVFFTSCSNQNVSNSKSKKWGYKKENGPEVWSKMKKQYRLCETGKYQSPINLLTRVKVNQRNNLVIDEELTYFYKLKNENLQFVIPDKKVKVSFNNEDYYLKYLTFHNKSEHTINGKKQDFEIQFHHSSKSKKRLILSLFANSGSYNGNLGKLLIGVNERNKKYFVKEFFNLYKIIPQKSDYWLYRGSESFPPCHEPVTRIVFRKSIEMARDQMERVFLEFGENARPVQKSIRAVKTLQYIKVK